MVPKSTHGQLFFLKLEINVLIMKRGVQMKKILLLSLMSLFLVSCGSDSDSEGDGRKDTSERDMWGVTQQPVGALDMTSVYGVWEETLYLQDAGESIMRIAIAKNPNRILVALKCQINNQVVATAIVQSNITIQKFGIYDGKINIAKNLVDMSNARCPLDIERGDYFYYLSQPSKDISLYNPNFQNETRFLRKISN